MKNCKINKLKEQLENLKWRDKYLLEEFRGYQRFYKGTNSPAEAERFFYEFKSAFYAGDPYEEGRYNCFHVGLKPRIKENRKERNEVIKKIREIKDQIKIEQRLHISTKNHD